LIRARAAAVVVTMAVSACGGDETSPRPERAADVERYCDAVMQVEATREDVELFGGEGVIELVVALLDGDEARERIDSMYVHAPDEVADDLELVRDAILDRSSRRGSDELTAAGTTIDAFNAGSCPQSEAARRASRTTDEACATTEGDDANAFGTEERCEP
jgi:hypothetical protein